MEDYYTKNNDDYASDIIISNNINSSLFSSSGSSNTSSTSPPSTPSATTTRPTATDGAGSQLYRARLILENHLYDELLNRYKLAIARLRELSRDATTLQEENEMLRLANDELVRRLNQVLSVSEQPYVTPTTGGWSTTSNDNDNNNNNNNNNNNIGSNNNTNSPTSTVVDGENDEDEQGDERVITLPKSISVRSPGYFKLLNLPTSNTTNHQPPSPSQQVNGAKLRVKKEVKALEMDVFNQGMYKTEICNKWQETGTCPYGQHCQFAHGISELRPVIRHPRYKTQVCRMVLAGVTCPYGHRCHFRHSLP